MERLRFAEVSAWCSEGLGPLWRLGSFLCVLEDGFDGLPTWASPKLGRQRGAPLIFKGERLLNLHQEGLGACWKFRTKPCIVYLQVAT